jgi:hypothetical protein
MSAAGTLTRRPEETGGCAQMPAGKGCWQESRPGGIGARPDVSAFSWVNCGATIRTMSGVLASSLIS